MRLRTRLITLFAIFAAVGLVTSTGAFSSVTAQRTVSVDVAGDDAALLRLVPHSGPNGAYATLQNGQLEIDVASSQADGVNPNAITRLNAVFNITNQGSQAVSVYLNETGDHPEAVTFEAGDGTPIDDSTNAVNVPVGGTVEVTIVIDTTGQGLGAGTSLLDSITVHAEA